METFATQLQIFSVLFTRLLAMFTVAPGFSGETLSYFSRVGLAFITAALVTPVSDMPPSFITLVSNRYLTILFEQAVIGIFIGSTMQFLFAAYQLAGEFFSVQMGFGISEVFDPLAQVSLPLMGTIKNLIALLVFFVSGAHLFLIKAVVFSFERIPYFSIHFFQQGEIHNTLVKYLALLGSGMFITALKISMPVMGTLLLVSLTLGFLSKAAPQMNILMLGFPLKILVGFMVLMTLSPMIVEGMFEQMDSYFSTLDNAIKHWPR